MPSRKAQLNLLLMSFCIWAVFLLIGPALQNAADKANTDASPQYAAD